MSAATRLGAVSLVEEAIGLVIRGGAAGLVRYYVGTIPLAFGLLFFWADMAHSAFAARRCLVYSLLVALAFIWSRYWQARYAQYLLSLRAGRTPARTGAVQTIQMALQQAFIHSLGLVALPLAAASTVTFVWVQSALHSACVLGDGTGGSVRKVLGRSWGVAAMAPGRKHLTALILAGAGLVLYVNVLSGFVLVPVLLQRVLGLEGEAPLWQNALLSSTTMVGGLVIAYCALDPVAKAVGVLECYYCESRRSGDDLIAELRALRRSRTGRRRLPRTLAALLMLALLSLIPAPARGEAVTPPAPETLDRTIADVVQRPAYAWRLPRRESAEEEQRGPVHHLASAVAELVRDAIETVGGWFRAAGEWLGKVLPKRRARSDPGGAGIGVWGAAVEWLVYGLVLVVGVSAVFAAVKMYRGRFAEMQPEAAVGAVETPDARDERTPAEALPSDAWLSFASERMAAGDYRQAVRGVFLASLVSLSQAGLLTLGKNRTNRDYERQLAVRAAREPELPPVFSASRDTFERVWYGMHDIDRDDTERYAELNRRFSSLS